MSDLLTAAAAALGTPEALVKRSAEARAGATGATVDEILTAWAGGAPAPTATPAPEPATEEPSAPAGAGAGKAPAPSPEIVVEIPSASPPPRAVEVGPYKPPVLVGATDNPLTVLAGVVGLFIVVLLVGLVGPAIPTTNAGARTSNIDFSAAAIEGRQVYAELGCAACHTQMVRPVVADVGLGAVTLNDTNQIPGVRRFGPDLSNVGARIAAGQLGPIVKGLGEHPVHSLSDEELAAITAFLAESATGGAG
jgi:Cytochrome C oxidase, mono-heme subunit/FixO